MKILFATYWYLPHVGGVHNYVEELSQHLTRQGHHVDILAHHPDMQKIWMMSTGRYIDKAKIKDYVYEQVLGFFHHELPLVDPWVRWREIERYVFELCATLLGVNNYDLIHTQDIVSTRAIARIKPAHVHHVATIHGILASEYLLSGEIKSQDTISYAYAKAEEYFGFTSADQTIIPSHWVEDQVTSGFGVPKGTLTHIPYGIDIERLHRQSRQRPDPLPGNTAGNTIILCPARLVPVKGHQYLFTALTHISGRHRVVLWLAGDGKHKDELQRQVSHDGLERVVQFLGARDDLPQLMRKADIIVLPSVQDALPFSVMEAQILGKPIVASRVGGIPEMIESGKTGILVEPANAQALARALVQLIESPNLRLRIGQEAQAWAQKSWALDAMLKRTTRVYHEVLRQTMSEVQR